MSAVDLSGRTVIVTGGAAGVGRGIALACGTAGAHVVVASRRENGGDVVDEIVGRGGAASWSQCDVGRPGIGGRARSPSAVERTGAVHAVVHNATSNRSSEPHRLEDVSIELLDEHAAVSLRGAYHCARAARLGVGGSHTARCS